MHPADDARLDNAIAFLQATDTGALVGELVPELGAAELASVVATCELRHAALLVFPASLDDVDAALAARGLAAAGEPKPSVVVKERLSKRYRRPLAELDVAIMRVPVPLPPPAPDCAIELFVLPVPPGSPLETVAAGEREHDDEAHVALAVGRPDGMAIAALRSIFTDHGWMRPDGGGYNRREGNTVLYFRDPGARDHFFRRLELLVPATIRRSSRRTGATRRRPRPSC